MEYCLPRISRFTQMLRSEIKFPLNSLYGNFGQFGMTLFDTLYVYKV